MAKGLKPHEVQPWTQAYIAISTKIFDVEAQSMKLYQVCNSSNINDDSKTAAEFADAMIFRLRERKVCPDE